MRALIAAAIVIVLAAGPADAASAATDVELSSDGVTYSSSLPDGLFSALGAMVPSTTRTGTFWIRNGTSQVAYLRLGLASAHASDGDYASALGLLVVVDGVAGTRQPFSAAAICSDLMPPTIVEAGQAVRVDAELSLGDLRGRSAQRAVAAIALAVSLSDAPAGSAVTACSDPVAQLPIVEASTAAPTPAPTATPTSSVQPGPSTSPTPRPSGSAGTATTPSGVTPTASASPAPGGATPVPTATVLVPPVGFAFSGPLGTGWGTLWPLGGLVLGALIFTAVTVLRRRRHEEEAVT